MKPGTFLKESYVTLAEVLKENGYITAAFTGGGYVSHEFGFAQGFDLYHDAESFEGMKGIYPSVFKWLEENRENNFFLFLHSYDVHDPFDPPQPFSQMFTSDYEGRFKNGPISTALLRRINGLEETQEPIHLIKEDIDYIIAQYDGGIRYVDRYIGELLDKLEELNLDNNTLIMLTADHGEDLMDHGHIWHRDVYDENILVPLILKYPPLLSSGKKVNAQVRSIDIVPTIASILNIKSKSPDWEGQSFLSLVLGKEGAHPEYAFSVGAGKGKDVRFSVRTEKWKPMQTN